MDATSAANGPAMADPRPTPKWLRGLQQDYHAIFVEEWSPYFGFVLLVSLAMMLMASGVFWGVFGGLKLWGDHFNNLIGLGGLIGVSDHPKGVLDHQMSVMDIALVLGAFTAALMSMQFAIRRAPWGEYVWGALGGALMGIGATLAGGCTTGGFFVPLTFSAPTGWAMWIGLMIGAILGIRFLLWSMENITWGTAAPDNPEPRMKRWFPLVGVAVALGVAFWGWRWLTTGEAYTMTLALMMLAGYGIGFVMHRARLCFARAIREPFMTGEGTMTKAMILALGVGIVFGSILMQKGAIDPWTAISTRFWIGALSGGVIFGFGMVLAGGCASGSLWRVGEGHLKLVVAVFFFAWIGSVASAVLGRLGLTAGQIDVDYKDGMVEFSRLGTQAWLPDMLGGWGATYAVMFAILAVWWAFTRYNESTERFTVF